MSPSTGSAEGANSGTRPLGELGWQGVRSDDPEVETLRATLIAEAGIELEDCYAFGDNYNDVEMLQYVPNSVAMGNAPDEVKSYARHITADVGNDGIARGLEKVGLL